MRSPESESDTSVRTERTAQERQAENSASSNLPDLEGASRRTSHAARRSDTRATQIMQRLRETLGIARDRPKCVHNSGRMDRRCSGCGALHFRDEKTTSDGDVYATCCAKDTVEISALHRFPATNMIRLIQSVLRSDKRDQAPNPATRVAKRGASCYE